MRPSIQERSGRTGRRDGGDARTQWQAVSLVVASQALDALTFALVVVLGISGRELNPFMSGLYSNLGLWAVETAKLIGLIAISFGAMALRRHPRLLLGLALVGTIGFVANSAAIAITVV